MSEEKNKVEITNMRVSINADPKIRDILVTNLEDIRALVTNKNNVLGTGHNVTFNQSTEIDIIHVNNFMAKLVEAIKNKNTPILIAPEDGNTCVAIGAAIGLMVALIPKVEGMQIVVDTLLNFLPCLTSMGTSYPYNIEIPGLIFNKEIIVL